MKEISNFVEFHNELQSFRKNSRWIFRGHSDKDWEIKPKAGRIPFNKISDLEYLKSWKRRGIEYLNKTPVDDWEWMAIAQHHGLPTRLLDWTHNPLVALFFTCNELFEKDGLIIIYSPGYVVIPENISPSKKRKLTLFKPKAITNRISKQSALFTIHNPPDVKIEDSLRDTDKLEKIVVKKESKKELLSQLDHYGINYASLFPDLDGLSKYFCWFLNK